LVRTNFRDVAEGLFFHLGSCIESNYALNYALQTAFCSPHFTEVNTIFNISVRLITPKTAKQRRNTIYALKTAVINIYIMAVP
jgi:hypothetical protein